MRHEKHLAPRAANFRPLDLTDDEGKARALARQGVRHIRASRMWVVNPQGVDLPGDGVSVGEIVLQRNTLMAGYYGNEAATNTAFAGGEFHTGDLAVRHPDGYVEIRDWSKDIISGGGNISSLEIESVLHQHPAVLLAAVVAAPDDKWGEIRCAFIELKDSMTSTPEEPTVFYRAHLASFKVPRKFVFQSIPKTATGKVQKFQLRSEISSAGEAWGQQRRTDHEHGNGRQSHYWEGECDGVRSRASGRFSARLDLWP